MRKSLAAIAVVAFAASSVRGANLDLTVRSGGSSSIQVSPGAVVNYEVIGRLTDTSNLGIALIGADLDFDGGDLSAANIPNTPPMSSFVPNEGITNPFGPCPPACGYGGTIIGGNLIQWGGGQNTIMNTAGNAPFPVGVVTTHIGHSDVVLLTGSLTAPNTLGTYHLIIPPESVFGNQIRAGEDAIPFWATEAFGVGQIVNLSIEVAAGGVSLIDAVPFCNDSLPRRDFNTVRLTFDGAITAPSSSEIQILAITDGGGTTGLNLAANFTFSVEGNILVAKDNGGTLANETWYTIRNAGTWPGVADFKVDYSVVIGDADNNGATGFSDLVFINNRQTPTADDVNRSDIDSNGGVGFSDIIAANNFNGSSAPTKPTGHNCSIVP